MLAHPHNIISKKRERLRAKNSIQYTYRGMHQSWVIYHHTMSCNIITRNWLCFYVSHASNDVLREGRVNDDPIEADKSNFLHPVIYYYRQPPGKSMSCCLDKVTWYLASSPGSLFSPPPREPGDEATWYCTLTHNFQESGARLYCIRV